MHLKRLKLPKIFQSLNYPNFRNYFIGHTLSTLGTWIQQVALAWLVYELTHSAALLGLITFFALAPQLVISPFVGALIDKLNKRKALIFVQVLFFIQALGLALCTYFHWLNQSSILALSLLLGVLSAIDTPLRQSFISDLVEDKNYIANALALNAMIFNSCRFIGPPIAGLLLVSANPLLCFILNALSYFCLIIALMLMKNIQVIKAKGSISNVLKEGYLYVFHHVEYKWMMLSIAVLNLTASSYVAILPIFAKDYLKGNETTLGYLWGAAGIGSFLSALLLANTQNENQIKNRIFYNMLFCILGLTLLAVIDMAFFYYFAMFCLGFGISTTNVSTNILIQRHAPSDFRGRIVSIYTSLRFGFDALGGLCAGILATYIGVKNTMLIFAVLLASFTLLKFFKDKKIAALQLHQ